MDVTRYRLPLRFDAARLQADLAVADASVWQPHFHKEDFAGDWRGVALRSASGRADDLLAHPLAASEYRPTPLLEQCHYFAAVIAKLALTLRGARLLSLGPGSQILPHRDRGLAYRFGEARLHIPIVSGAAVEFRVAGEPVVMAPGECWYLDLDQEHSVVNRGHERRVHLVLDAVRDERCDQWLAGAEMAPREAGHGIGAGSGDAMDEALRRQVLGQLLRRDDDTSRALAASIQASLQ